MVSATEEGESLGPWKPSTISVIIFAAHSALSPKVPSTRCQRGSVARSAIYIYPLRSPTAAHSCLAMSANSRTSFRSRVALSPSSPGQVENVVVPTLRPMEASLVMWFRGLEAMMAGIPSPSLSHNACNLLAHSAVVREGTFALKMK